jgi:hypothetical protein
MGLPLFFARRFPPPPPGVTHCGRQNVVLHAKMKLDPYRAHLRAHVGQPAHPPPTRDHFSSASPDSQFRHARFNLGACGKILAFKSQHNIIRAGKHSHADALASCLLYLCWSQQPGWPARIATPNLVASAQLALPPTPRLKNHPRATHSTKFPGIAIKLAANVTTEIYESGAFILPGITSAPQLSAALHEVAALSTHPRVNV